MYQATKPASSYTVVADGCRLRPAWVLGVGHKPSSLTSRFVGSIQ